LILKKVMLFLMQILSRRPNLGFRNNLDKKRNLPDNEQNC
jgi:hypothetical protein